jgi:hypothetical protein
MSTPNVALLKQTLAHIEAHPETWKQEYFRCGTGMCFAGWAAELHGAKWAYPAEAGWLRSELITPKSEDGVGTEPIPIEGYAAKILGIEHTRRYDDEDFEYDEDEDFDLGTIPLFEARNSLDDLRRLVAEICAEAEVPQ